MKYNFSINQKAAAELGDIDVIDCCIIDWLHDLHASVSPRILARKTEDGIWVDYGFFIGDNPVLGLNDKSAVSKRFKRLVEKGYITVAVKKQKVYVKLLAKTELLYSDNREPLTTVNGVLTTVNGAVDDGQLTINTNTSKLKTSNTAEAQKSIRRVYDHYIAATGKNPKQYKLSENRRKRLHTRVKDAGEDMLLRAIDNMVSLGKYNGDNKISWTADLDWLLRSYEHVEKVAAETGGAANIPSLQEALKHAKF